MALTDAQIRAAVRAGEWRKLFDGGGLYLLIAPPRAPGWRLKYRHKGAEKSISLGMLKDVSLKRARAKCAEARALLADGVDPSAQRKAERAAAVNTFEAIAREWLETQKHLEPETKARTEARLERWVYAKLGKRPIADVKASDVLTVLRAIEERGSHDTAHRARAEVSRIFRYAVVTDRAERDPIADLKGALSPLRVRSFAALRSSEGRRRHDRRTPPAGVGTVEADLER